MQDSQSGKQGAEFGYESARRVAELLGARRVRAAQGNVYELNGVRVVIKSARKGTNFIGITHTMLPTIRGAIAALEDKEGKFSVYQLDRGFLDARQVTPSGYSKETQVFFRVSDIKKYAMAVGSSLDTPPMSFWVTTQWPHRVDMDPNTPRWGVYLPDGREEAGADLRSGDLVAVYESKEGRPAIRETASGQKSIVKTHEGRQGVVAILKVTSELLKDPDTEPEKYTDGTSMWWRWYAETEPYSTSGFMSRADLNDVLGLDRDYRMRGFGDRNSGLKRVTKEQFDKISAVFRAAGAVPEMREALKKPKFVRWGTGVEGPLHKLLKEAVAADPSKVLGEPGLRTIKMEYPFPSGDSADVLLQDGAGKIVGLEVEPEVHDNDFPGMLQAIKYRFMGAMMENRRFSDSRSFLVASYISPLARKFCAQYEIECFEVDPKTLKIKEPSGAETAPSAT